MPFHGYYTAALVAGLTNLQLSPSGLAAVMPRLTSEADGWAHFRVKSCAFRLHRNNSITGAQGIGFIGGVQDTLPQSTSQLMELMSATVISDVLTIPGEWVKPSAKELAGPLPWYKTINGTADATEEAPGYIVITGNTTEVFSVEVKAVFEFKVSVATANTPAEVRLVSALRALRQANARSRAQVAVARVLSGPPTESGGSPSIPK